MDARIRGQERPKKCCTFSMSQSTTSREHTQAPNLVLPQWIDFFENNYARI